MRPLSMDLSVYRRLNLERPPVGVKFLYSRPEGLERLDKQLALCEMIGEAQERGSFYFTQENEECVAKSIVLGMEELHPALESGQVGVKLEIFQDERANARLYQYFPRLAPGTVRYVALSALDCLSFDPDLLVLLASPSQAEIVMRAMTYSTGEPWESRSTPVVGCAWIYAYPYLSGKVNYVVTGMTFGMKAKEVFPEGRVLISIPYHWIPIITRNLEEMNWVPPGYTDGKEGYKKRERELFASVTQG